MARVRRVAPAVALVNVVCEVGGNEGKDREREEQAEGTAEERGPEEAAGTFARA